MRSYRNGESIIPWLAVSSNLLLWLVRPDPPWTIITRVKMQGKRDVHGAGEKRKEEFGKVIVKN